MEINLRGRDLAPSPVPDHYFFLPWEDSLLDAFAQAKYLSFHQEFDANVFPCLAEFEGCRRLMREIAQKPGFLPGATWLAAASAGAAGGPQYSGTVQGVRDKHGLGAIQNLGVAPEHRGCGLGTSLLMRCLAGFREAGIRRVYLDVTAQNQDAIRLYRRIGFVTIRTIYKAAEAAYSP
jgi:ribosomal protein S18 acetylase RimI-like enzyme